MIISDCPPETVVVDWASETMYFRNKADQIIRVKFSRPKGKGINRFQICCCIAIAQEFYIKKNNPTDWKGANDLFLQFLKEKFGKGLTRDSVSTYWSIFRRGQMAAREYTKFSIENESSENKGNPETKLSADTVIISGEQLFNKIDGYILGSYEKLESQYKLWSIDIINTDKEYTNLYKWLLSILDKMKIAGQSDYDNSTWIEVVKKIKGSPLELKELIKDASETVSIAGQNLYFLVRDEIKAVKQENYNKKEYLRKKLSDWLDEEENRRIEMLILDPCSEASVLYYAQKYGKDFIPHLCGAIPRFQIWQKEMGPKGLDARVAQIAPYSFVAIDAGTEVEDTKMGKMAMTVTTLEKRSPKRSAYLIKRELYTTLFDNIYEDYCQLFISDSTRSIQEVTEDEIAKCRKLLTLVKS